MFLVSCLITLLQAPGLKDVLIHFWVYSFTSYTNVHYFWVNFYTGIWFRSGFIFCLISNCSSTIIKTTLLWLNYTGYVKNQLPGQLMQSSLFCFIDLCVCGSANTTQSYLQQLQVLKLNRGILPTIFLFQNCFLGMLDPVAFHVSFQIILSVTTKDFLKFWHKWH